MIDESHPNWWQDKKNPDRHGIRIPVLDENGIQKMGARNRLQWKRVLTDATGWNNPKNCELWRSEWAKVCNEHLPLHNQVDHRSYEKQGKLQIPTIHEGADARKIEQKFLAGQEIKRFVESSGKSNHKTTKHVIAKDTGHLWEKYRVHYHYGRSD